jgi:methylated-DNA-[protein]-cysteine S-methyltransferase
MPKTRPKGLIYTIFTTDWGYFGLAGTKQGLLRSHLPHAKAEIVEAHLLKGIESATFSRSYFNTLQKCIIAYFGGSYVNFGPDLSGLDGLSPFCRAVLQACRHIQHGRTLSYRDLAKKIRRPKSARAIGNALATNPLPLIIPCHRVIRTDGKIGGFTATGGAQMKKRMLKLEQSIKIL